MKAKTDRRTTLNYTASAQQGKESREKREIIFANIYLIRG